MSEHQADQITALLCAVVWILCSMWITMNYEDLKSGRWHAMVMGMFVIITYTWAFSGFLRYFAPMSEKMTPLGCYRLPTDDGDVCIYIPSRMADYDADMTIQLLQMVIERVRRSRYETGERRTDERAD